MFTKVGDSDLKFDVQLGFAKTHHINTTEKSRLGLRLGELQKIWRFDFYSAAALLAMQSAVLATAITSVRPSGTRWYCTQTNEDRIMRSSL